MILDHESGVERRESSVTVSRRGILGGLIGVIFAKPVALALRFMPKRRDPRLDIFAQMLSQANDILDDMEFTEPGRHFVPFRTVIPAETWRLLNKGASQGPVIYCNRTARPAPDA